jgi:hypothetical protein
VCRRDMPCSKERRVRMLVTPAGGGSHADLLKIVIPDEYDPALGREEPGAGALGLVVWPMVKLPPFRCHCAAVFSSCATSELAQGTVHRPADGRHLLGARRPPAIPDRPAFPSMAHPHAV